MTPRGIRNNNPGNIELGSDRWQGLSDSQTDGRFAQFDAPEYGIRAMAKVLSNYQSKHGLNTPRQMISRWAPSNENDVGSYAASVAKRSGLDPDRPIDLSRDGAALIEAMIQHENGQQPFSREQVLKGIEMAGISGGEGSNVVIGSEGNDTPSRSAYFDSMLKKEAEAPSEATETGRSAYFDSFLKEDAEAEDPSASPEDQGEAPGRAEAFGRGVLQGLTFNTSDEIYASSQQPTIAQKYIVARRAMEEGATEEEASQIAQEWFERQRGDILEDVRGANEAARDAHGGFYTAGEITGAIGSAAPAAVALGPAALARVPASLGGKMVAGATAGGAAGAVDGALREAGDAEDGERLAAAGPGALKGGAFGVAGGMLAPAAGSVAGKVAENIFRRSDKSAAKTLGVSPEAAEVVANAARNDGLESVARNIDAAGDSAMLADGGPTLSGVLDTTIQKAGPGGKIAREAIDSRVAAESADLQIALNDAFSSPSASTAVATKGGRAAARKNLYDFAYKRPIDYSSEVGTRIEGLLDRVPGSIIQRANNLMKVEGATSKQIMAAIDDAGGVTYQQLPDVRQLDYITRALNDVAKRGDGQGVLGGATNEGRIYAGLARDIRNGLKEAVPQYKKALDFAATEIGEKEAKELGGIALRASTSRDDLAEAIKDMAASEKRQMRDGVRLYIDDTIANVRRTLTDSNMDAREGMKVLQELSSRSSQDKLRMILGNDLAKALKGRLDKASKAFELRARTADNSKTFARQSVSEAIDDITKPGVLGELAKGSPTQAGRAVVQKFTGMSDADRVVASEKIAAEIAGLLTGPKGSGARKAAGDLIQMLGKQELTKEVVNRVRLLAGASTGLGAYQSNSLLPTR